MAHAGAARYARVAVEVSPAHLDRPFDYRVPDGAVIAVGQRVRVVFSGRRRTGWVVGLTDQPEADPAKVRPLALIQGERAWFDASDLRWLRWVADRWAASLADVLRHAMPARVAGVEREAAAWGPPPAWHPADRPPCPASVWRPYAASAMLQAAASSGFPGPPPAFWWRPLPGDDHAGMTADLVARCLAAGRSALVLAPDHASPLLVAAHAVAGAAGADLRASHSDRERYRAFLRCRTGHARVAVGERGAVFAPLPDLGLVVVDDEASPAYKERRSPRYHARDVALGRARMAGAAAVVVADLPSAAVWRLLQAGHVQAVAADRATERSRAPRVEVVDLSAPRPGTRRARFTSEAARSLSAAVGDRGAAVVLAARGGQGAALACRRCGTRLACPVCDGSVRPRRPADGEETREGTGWECPSCGWAGAPFTCPVCGDDRNSPLAAGAGRLAAELARSHPDADVVRMEGFDAPGPARRPGIGVMTRGSVVTRPGWLGDQPAAVVVVPDADAMLSRPALEAGEDALRLWMAVARWTVPDPRTPAAKPGRVVVQTRDRLHPVVQALVRWDPEGFWRLEAERRAELGYPPARWLVRVVGPARDGPDVAAALRDGLPGGDEVLGPDPDGAVLVKTADLHGTLAALRPLHHGWAKDDRKIRVDVDPAAAG